jgi:cell division protease FtsH
MHVLPNHDPVHKVTIVPRGMAGGYTMSIPEDESNLMTRDKFRAQLVALLGGRVAEETSLWRLHEPAPATTWSASPAWRARWSRSGGHERTTWPDPLRRARGDDVPQPIAFSEHRNYSDKVAQEIDEEVKQLVDEAHSRCHQLLAENWDAMQRVANFGCWRWRRSNAADFQALMRGETPIDSTENHSGQSG